MWDPANPASLGDPRWSSSTEEDRLLYSALIENAERLGKGNEWRRDMVQAAVHMVSQLSGGGIMNNSVVRAEKKGIAILNTFVSFHEIS